MYRPHFLKAGSLRDSIHFQFMRNSVVTKNFEYGTGFTFFFADPAAFRTHHGCKALNGGCTNLFYYAYALKDPAAAAESTEYHGIPNIIPYSRAFWSMPLYT